MRALVYPDPRPARPGGHIPKLRLVTSHQLDAERFVTHHFTLDEFESAYDVFADAATSGALEVVLARSTDGDK